MKHYTNYRHYFSLHVNPNKYMAVKKNGRIFIVDIAEGKIDTVENHGTLLFYEQTRLERKRKRNHRNRLPT